MSCCWFARVTTAFVSESEKTSEDMDREASLLQRMLDVIEEKSKLVDNQDEMRAQTGALPRNSIVLDDSSLSAGTASKSKSWVSEGWWEKCTCKWIHDLTR